MRFALLPSGWTLNDLQLLFPWHFRWHSNSSATSALLMTWPTKAWSKSSKKMTIFLMQTDWIQEIKVGRVSLKSVYLPTWVSKTLPQKSVFATTNKITKRMLRATMTNWVIHQPAISKIVSMLLCNEWHLFASVFASLQNFAKALYTACQYLSKVINIKLL